MPWLVIAPLMAAWSLTTAIVPTLPIVEPCRVVPALRLIVPAAMFVIALVAVRTPFLSRLNSPELVKLLTEKMIAPSVVTVPVLLNALAVTVVPTTCPSPLYFRSLIVRSAAFR